MIIDISVAVIALAFVALVIYLIMLTVRLRKTLGHVNQSLVEATKAIEQAHLLETDLENKMIALDPLFNSVENVGEVLESKTASFRDRRESCCDNGDDVLIASDFVAMADLGLRLWNKFNKRR